MVATVNNKLKISIIMATCNRAETIPETFHHLAEQELDSGSYELIVIDDGSSDNTRAVIEEWIPRLPFRVRHLHHSNHGPGYSQNRGLEIAGAPLVLLMADDIFMSRQTLKMHVSMHEAHPEQEVAVFGLVKQSPTLDGSVFLRTWDPFGFRALAGLRELPYYRFGACNVSAKREFVMRYGPFRDQRGRGGPLAHEDAELGYQLSRGGLRILFCPEALGWHHHITTLEGACRKAYQQGLNFGDFRDRVGQPEIAVAYHVLDFSTLRDHLRVWFGPRRRYVSPPDRNPVMLLGRYVLRTLAFNSLTVPLFWKPLLERAEHDPAVARIVRASFYRGLTAFYFRRGYREGRTWIEAPATPATQA